jgi:F-type H+-transporting ATPase subunit epsilon
MADNEVLHLSVTTPTGPALDIKADTVAAPSVKGEFGVYPNHLPLLAALRAGVLKYEVKGEQRYAAVGPGFVEAAPDKVLLLTEKFALPENIDREDSLEELAEAEKRLDAFPKEHVGPAFDEIQRDIEWAQACLEVLEEIEAR